METPRHIVLSRKGFDSKYGGCASPILADGSLLSMPIREDGMPLRYRDLASGTCNLGDVVDKLSGCNVRPESGVHLDPDLRRDLHGRANMPWQPLFGQSGPAEKHLENQEVKSNDLFLFFGWFRQVDQTFRFKKSADDEHVIWGWLQIDRCFDPTAVKPAWAGHHPHCSDKPRKYNRVYVGRQTLSFAPNKPGAGVFAAYNRNLRLTHPEQPRRRSEWRIPSFFQGKLSYHTKKNWIKDGTHCTISSAKIGQEFVFDTSGREAEAQAWLDKLFSLVPEGESF